MAAMLSEPYETLKRRIRIMTMPLPRKPWAKGGLLAGVGTVLVALAGWAPGPTDAQDEEPEGASVQAEPELVAVELAPTSEAMFETGIRDGVQKEYWVYAIHFFRSGFDFGPTPPEEQELTFWLGYSLFQEARAKQEPQTVETATESLLLFREALSRLRNSGGYADERVNEDSRQEILRATEIFIEIQEAIIRRGR